MRRLRCAVFAVLCALLSSVFSFAHPMGNFSINHESKIRLGRDSVEIRYFLDFAEIPTYQELQAAGIQAKADDPAATSYAAQKGVLLSRGLIVEVDGRKLPLKAISQGIIFPPGAGGLPTMKLGFVFRASILAHNGISQHTFRFEDGNFADRAGWKEVVIEGQDVSLKQSTAAQSDRSAELTNYPTDLINSPPQQTVASAEFILPVAIATVRPRTSERAVLASGSPAAESRVVPTQDEPTGLTTTEPATAKLNIQPNARKTPRSRFTELIATEHLGTWFVVSALLIALSLGALHALEPGHGKTIVAAYLVGSRGSTRDAVGLGATVTVAHTAGVYILGLITLYASRYIVPERLYPWVSLLSGMLIIGVGIAIFLQHITGASLTHEEDPSRPHSHWNFGLSRRNGRSAAGTASISQEKGSVSLKQLITLGITGGIIPCPAALVVLLSAVALHRIGFGLVLIVAFSLGLAGVLIAIGVLMVHTRKLISRFDGQGRVAARWLPILSSIFITGLGIAMLWQPISALHPHLNFNELERAPALLAVIGLGLLLGIRHSTDADHVVAVTTIVSQQRRIRDAAMIGALWGIGHTLTIGVVGSAIILFNVAIPPRIGLLMEFSVAIMLIVLGILNLTGVMPRISSGLTRNKTGGLQREPKLTIQAESFLDRVAGRIGLYQVARPLIVGTVHGLAGSAAVALLVLATITAPIWAIVYLLIFGLGTIVGMMVMTVFIALPFTFSGRFLRLNSGLRLTSGLISMAFGLFLAYHIGFVDGLFSSSPQWTPR